MKRPAMLLLILIAAAAPAGAQECSGFPWTVTATPAASGVNVHVCGTALGCHPHAPTATVAGSTIAVTLRQAEPPDCICIQPADPFEQSLLVGNVPPGPYDVVVYSLDCLTSIEMGRSSIVVGEAAAIPTLDTIGLAVLALAIGAAGIWRLRP